LRDSAREKRQKLDDQTKAKQERARAQDEADFKAAEARKHKRQACSKRASAAKLHLMKRHAFMKKCLAE
jgi:hypothetical protein